MDVDIDFIKYFSINMPGPLSLFGKIILEFGSACSGVTLRWLESNELWSVDDWSISPSLSDPREPTSIVINFFMASATPCNPKE